MGSDLLHAMTRRSRVLEPIFARPKGLVKASAGTDLPMCVTAAPGRGCATLEAVYRFCAGLERRTHVLDPLANASGFPFRQTVTRVMPKLYAPGT